MLAPYLGFQISVSIETLVKGVAKPDAIVCVPFTCILVNLIKFKLPCLIVLAQPRAKKLTTHVHCGCDGKTILQQIPISTLNPLVHAPI